MSRERRRTRAGAAAKANVAVIGRTVQKPEPDEPIYAGRRPGRPTKLTPEAERRFLDCLRAGNYRTVCSRYAGLAPDTVEKWIKRGRGHSKDRPATPEYIRFVRLVDEAEAQPEVLVVGNIVARSAKDHNAGLAWLRSGPKERRERWRRPGDEPPDDEMPDGSPLPRPQLLPGGGSGATLALPPGTVIDQRHQSVVFISPDQVPDVVSQLLAQQRIERAAQRQAQAAATPLPAEASNDTRIARLDGLRADAADEDEDDEPEA
jgi:hypothetical protein